jgi:excisionase family DNA binding protein
MMNLITKEQLSKKVGVTPRTIESWMRLGHIPYIKIGRSVRFDEGDVLKSLKRRHGRNMDPYDIHG